MSSSWPTTSRETLRACIEPLTGVPWVDVTVVDNASPDDSAGAIEDLPARIIRAPRNGGFAYGCNIGIQAGSAEFVLLLNPDAAIDAPSLSVLVDALRREPSLAGVGPGSSTMKELSSIPSGVFLGSAPRTPRHCSCITSRPGPSGPTRWFAIPRPTTSRPLQTGSPAAACFSVAKRS